MSETSANSLSAFLREAATYFSNRSTGGEDAAFWSNFFNAANCEKAAGVLDAHGAVLARARAMLAFAQKHVCGDLCESVWRTANGRPMHSAKCQSITDLLATIDGITAAPPRGEHD